MLHLCIYRHFYQNQIPVEEQRQFVTKTTILNESQIRKPARAKVEYREEKGNCVLGDILCSCDLLILSNLYLTNKSPKERFPMFQNGWDRGKIKVKLKSRKAPSLEFGLNPEYWLGQEPAESESSGGKHRSHLKIQASSRPDRLDHLKMFLPNFIKTYSNIV